MRIQLIYGHQCTKHFDVFRYEKKHGMKRGKPISGFPLLKLARFFRYANVVLLLRKLQDSIPFLFKVDAS